MPRFVRLRDLATADLNGASEYYLREAGERTALEFIDSVEHAIGQIRRGPHAGSLRFAHELDIPDLRAWPLQRFPYVVFYVFTNREVDVWRILHSRREIPATLAPPET